MIYSRYIIDYLKGSVTEYIDISPSFQDIYKFLRQNKPEENIDDTEILNEVNLHCIRIINCHEIRNNLYKYVINDIADALVVTNESEIKYVPKTDFVLTLLCLTLQMINNRDEELTDTINDLQEYIGINEFKNKLNSFVQEKYSNRLLTTKDFTLNLRHPTKIGERCYKRNYTFGYNYYKPYLYPEILTKEIHIRTITNDYDQNTIRELINLYSTKAEKLALLDLIEKGYDNNLEADKYDF